MTIVGELISPSDRKLADYILITLRGLRMSKDLELAESAVRAERALTERLTETEKVGKRNGKEEPVHA